jgi:hypothetical protein
MSSHAGTRLYVSYGRRSERGRLSPDTSEPTSQRLFTVGLSAISLRQPCLHSHETITIVSAVPCWYSGSWLLLSPIHVATFSRQCVHLSLRTSRALLLNRHLHAKAGIVQGSHLGRRLDILHHWRSIHMPLISISIHRHQRLSVGVCLFRWDSSEECSLFGRDGRSSVRLWLVLEIVPARIRVRVSVRNDTARWTTLHLLHLLLYRVIFGSHIAVIISILLWVTLLNLLWLSLLNLLRITLLKLSRLASLR